MSAIGIVGAEAAKFTAVTEAAARALIRRLLAAPDAVAVSGRCPLGGIDVWAVEEAQALGRAYVEYPPATTHWATGYKPRNLKIARASAVVHCVTVETLPPTYRGMRFGSCYHCLGARPPHVKSGGCWTAMRAAVAQWHIIRANGTLVPDLAPLRGPAYSGPGLLDGLPAGEAPPIS